MYYFLHYISLLLLLLLEL